MLSNSGSVGGGPNVKHRSRVPSRTPPRDSDRLPGRSTTRTFGWVSRNRVSKEGNR